MLDIQANRLDYGTLLCPPEGYVFDQAIVTTYSLDLNALLAVPVALFYAQTLEGDLSGERLALLDAVRQLRGKVILFHQAGKIQVPGQYNRLFAYLEDCLVPVSLPRHDQSFHPKIWVIRFMPEQKSDPVRFRLLVLSRNLTFDRSWDVAVNLEGNVTDEEQKINDPLLDFIRYLFKHGKGRMEGTAAFINQLRRVEFKPPAGFGKLRFHPIGIPGHTHGLPNYKPEHLVIISPFVQDNPLKNILSTGPVEAFLFSRFEELHGLDEKLIASYKCFHLNPALIEGESALEGVENYARQDLHAKLFVQTRKGQCNWLLGSANATNPAAEGRNVEFMLELSGYGADIQGPRLVNTLLGEDGEKGIFVKYARPNELIKDSAKEALKQQVRLLECRLTKSGLRGELAQATNGVNHDLLVNLQVNPEVLGRFKVEIFPFGHEKLSQIVPRSSDPCLRFENLALVDLSCFVGVKITHPDLHEERRFLLQMKIELPEDRLNRIFTLLIKNQERFLEYLRFLLMQSPSKEALLQSEGEKHQALSGHSAQFGFGAVYEDLLLAVSRSPKKLKAVDAVIQRLSDESNGNEIIPLEFLELWTHFRGYIADE